MIFKAGDKVILINNTGMAASVGAMAVVTKTYEPTLNSIDVKWFKGPLTCADDGDKISHQQDGVYHTNHFAKTSMAEVVFDLDEIERMRNLVQS